MNKETSISGLHALCTEDHLFLGKGEKIRRKGYVQLKKCCQSVTPMKQAQFECFYVDRVLVLQNNERLRSCVIKPVVSPLDCNHQEGVLDSKMFYR